ncbi:MAG TPA: S8 family serine peptidase, partial [Pyrinomonadaceae bacterium]|nr:S8 family serine peptidase [Pyrinomonadaceae bacterium]
MKKLLPLFTLALSIGVPAALYFAFPSSAQNVVPEASVRSAKDRIFEKLIEKSSKRGMVRVIVGIDQPIRRIGDLNRDEVAHQKGAIRNRQDAFLNRYPEANNESLINFEFIPFVAMTVSAPTLEAMRNDPTVLSIEEDVADAPTLAESTAVVGAPPVWNAGFVGTGQAVAILDTGVNKNHTFLQGKVVSEACYSRTVAGSSTSVCPGGASSSTDPNSGLNCDPAVNGCAHGTHVAGIAAGTSAGFSGVAKGGNLIAIQVFSRFDSAASCSSGAPCALSYASDQVLGLERVLALASTIDIAAVNMSLGGGQYFEHCDNVQLARKAAIDNLRSVNIPTIVSSGNNGYTNSMGAPACISSAFSVGSTGDGSSGATLDVVVSSSNSASFLNFLAPGRWITSSVAAVGSDNTFQAYSGTSMAAPHIAGAFAVMRSRNPGLTVDDAAAILDSTGTQIIDSRNNISKPRLQLDRAVSIAGSTCQSQPIFIGQTTSGQTLAATDCNFTDNFSRFFDRHTFLANAGQQVSIAMSAGFDAHLILLNSANQIVAEDGNGGGGTNARIPAGAGSFTIPATGSYSIIATSNPSMPPTQNSLGAYTLSLNGTCSYSFSSPGASFDTGGGAGNFNIEVSGSCPWSVASNGNWLTVTSSPTGTGNTTVNFTVAANTGAGRSATITGNGQTFTVNQSGTVSTRFDYDGDGRADLSVVRPANNTWYLLRGTAGYTA